MSEEFGERSTTDNSGGKLELARLEGETLPHQGRGASETSVPFSLGRYRITERLGTGGFATVYKGYDEVLGRPVAIKVPHQQSVDSPDALAAWPTEGKALGSLDHSGIVPVYDVGRTDDGRPFLVSKLIEGEDLRAQLRRGRPSRAAA